MSDSPLTDAVSTAISALEAIQIAAGNLDRQMAEAERRAAAAEKQAARDRAAKREAEGKVDGLRAEIIDTRAAVAGEVEKLRAEKEILATRDRESREELDRRNQREVGERNAKQIKSRGVTA